jgi:hypothetical protein
LIGPILDGFSMPAAIYMVGHTNNNNNPDATYPNARAGSECGPSGGGSSRRGDTCPGGRTYTTITICDLHVDHCRHYGRRGGNTTLPLRQTGAPSREARMTPYQGDQAHRRAQILGLACLITPLG